MFKLYLNRIALVPDCLWHQ